jgi:hypothetical protein
MSLERWKRKDHNGKKNGLNNNDEEGIVAKILRQKRHGTTQNQIVQPDIGRHK